MRKITLNAAAALSLILVSCGSSVQEAQADLPMKEQNTVSEAVTAAASPWDEVRFADEKFNILYMGTDSARNLIRADEYTGDTMNDALYERNLALQDTLGISVVYTEADSATDDCAKKIKQSVQAGDDDYQMCIVHRVDSIAEMAAGGYLYDYTELPFVKLDADWWEQSAMQTMSYLGHSYFAYNDIYPISTFCFFFNKKIAADMDLGNLYDVVYDGKWTIDTMKEMASAAAGDIDGDGKMTRSDRYGLAMRNATILSGFYFSGEMHLSENFGDHAELALMSDKLITLFDNTISFFQDTAVNYLRTEADLTITSGQILFYLDSLDNADMHRESEVDFGLLPYPKYNEEQKEYISFANPNLQCVPGTQKNPDMVGAAIEFLAENSQSVTDAFYEKKLKGKVAVDSDSAKMIDLMMSNYTVDFAANYCGFAENCTAIYNFYKILMREKRPNLTSFYEKYASGAQAEIDAIFNGN